MNSFLKGLAAMSLLGAGVSGVYIINEHQKYETIFDKGLIDYLEDGGKIKFSVKKEGESEELTTFPDFSTSVRKITVKISIKTNGTSGEGTLEDKANGGADDKGKTKTLLALNKGENWTWSCKLIFNKDGSTETELKEKNQLLNGTEGFFNKLKDENGSDNNKAPKEKFIRNCAKVRSKKFGIFMASGLKNNEIESAKEFMLVDGEESKLVFKNQEEYKTWFTS